MDNRDIYSVYVWKSSVLETVQTPNCKKKIPNNLTSVHVELQHLENIIYLVCTDDSQQLYMYSKEMVIC